MPKITDAKEALKALLEEIKLFRGLNGPVLETPGMETKARPGYSVFASSDPHVASSYANPRFDWHSDDTGAVFPFRARPQKVIEFPVKKLKDIAGNDFNKFEFDRVASQLKPGEALVARNVYDAGPRASRETDPEARFSYPSDVWALGPEVETTPLHKAKGGKISAFDAALQYVKNKLPQTGFFSTLDELIGQAPFEKAPLDQWRNYLQPGRTFEREGVRFPLKKEELDYTLNDPTSSLALLPPATSMSKDDLRNLVRQERPDLSLRVGIPRKQDQIDFREERFPEETHLHSRPGLPTDEPDVLDYSNNRLAPEITWNRYSDWAHTAPPEHYEESATRSTDLGPTKDPQHFGNDVISHSRTTIQPTIFQEPEEPHEKMMRLIEEIQSDRHQAAAARQMTAASITAPIEYGPRRGYRTPADEARLPSMQDEASQIRLWLEDQQNRLRRNPQNEDLRAADTARDNLDAEIKAIQGRVPDAPFKDPADYGGLEMRMQLLNAAKQGQDYLGLIRGKDVSERFSQHDDDAAGTSHVYDKVYPSVMKKLAAQYGIDVRNVQTNLRSSLDTATPHMRLMNWERIPDAVEDIRIHADDSSDWEDTDSSLSHLVTLLSNFREAGVTGDAWDEAGSGIRKLHDIYQEAHANPEAASRHAGSLESTWGNVSHNLNLLHSEYASRIRGGRPPLGGEATKSFPSMVLPHDIREKIKRIGVPIWALAGTAAGLAAQKEAEGDDMGYADGGKVVGMRGLSRKIGKTIGELMDKFTMETDPATRETLGNQIDRAVEHFNNTKRAEMNTGLEMATGGIARLKQLAESVGTEDTIARRKRILAGLASQLYGADPDDNQVKLLGGMHVNPFRTDSPDEYAARVKALDAGTLHNGGPGLFDEVQSMFLGSKQANAADKRLATLKNDLHSQLGIKDPHGFGENFDEALGTMLGQLPIPSMSEAKIVGKIPLVQRLKQLAMEAPKSVVEWLSPQVHPSMSNYLTGATAGAAINTLAGPDEPPTAGMAEGGSVEATKPLHQMLDLLKSRLTELNGAPNAFPISQAAPPNGSGQAQLSFRP